MASSPGGGRRRGGGERDRGGVDLEKLLPDSGTFLVATDALACFGGFQSLGGYLLGGSLALCRVEHDALQRLLSFGQRRCRLGRIGFGLARDPLVLGFQTIVLCGRLAALGVHELHENHLGGNEDKSPKQRVDEQIVAGQRVSEVQQHAGEGTRAETDHPAAHGVYVGVAGSEAGESDDDVPAVGANDDVQRVDGHGSDFPAIRESTEQNEAERGQKCHGDKCVHGHDALAAAHNEKHEQGAYQHGAQGVG